EARSEGSMKSPRLPSALVTRCLSTPVAPYLRRTFGGYRSDLQQQHKELPILTSRRHATRRLGVQLIRAQDDGPTRPIGPVSRWRAQFVPRVDEVFLREYLKRYGQNRCADSRSRLHR